MGTSKARLAETIQYYGDFPSKKTKISEDLRTYAKQTNTEKEPLR